VFECIFNALSEESDIEMAMIDGTTVKVHRSPCGDCGQSAARQRDRAQKGFQSQATGKSKGGRTTRILALTDPLGNLVRFVLMPGHRFDTVGVAPLIKGIKFDAMLADKAFDSDCIIAEMNERGDVISFFQHPRRAASLPRTIQKSPPHRDPSDIPLNRWRDCPRSANSNS